MKNTKKNEEPTTPLLLCHFNTNNKSNNNFIKKIFGVVLGNSSTE